MKNSIGISIFCVFDRKYTYFWKFVQKIKIFCWSWNLESRLIWISGIQWWYSFFLFLTIKIFLRQIWSKAKVRNCLFKVKLGTKTNLNMQNSMVVSIVSVLDWKLPFLENLVQKIAIVSLSWKLVLKLIRMRRIQ